MKELGVRVLLGARAQGLTDHGLVVTTEGERRQKPPPRPDSPLSAPARVGAGLEPLPETGNGEMEVAAEIVLVAIGRLPNTDDLGLEVVGARLDDGHRILVDASRRAARRVLAIGDITAGPALAHKAIAEAEVAAAGGQPWANQYVTIYFTTPVPSNVPLIWPP